MSIRISFWLLCILSVNVAIMRQFLLDNGTARVRVQAALCASCYSASDLPHIGAVFSRSVTGRHLTTHPRNWLPRRSGLASVTL